MKKKFIVLNLVLFVLVVFLAIRIVGLWKGSTGAGLVVTSPGQTNKVLINGKHVGETPFSSKSLTAKEVTLSVGSYSTQINISSGTETVVRRVLGPSAAFSFGVNVWLEQTSSPPSISVLSEPEGGEVLVDGVSVGVTPVLVSDINAGTHTVQVQKQGYRPSIVDLNITHGYRTFLYADLMLFPLNVDLANDSPKKVLLINDVSSEFFKVYDLSSTNPLLYSDTASWAEGVVFFIELFDLELPAFDYFVDYRGVLYNQRGNELAFENVSETDAAGVSVGYLGQDKLEELPEEVRKTVMSLKQGLYPLHKKAVVLNTGTGWLRVRDEPSLSSAEITRVNVGSTFTYVDESGDWVQIQLEDETLGWVYKDYIEIVEE